MMKYDQILECTLANNLEIHKDSVLLVCSTEYAEEIDIINDFHFNYDFDVIDIDKVIILDSLEDLYGYVLEKNICVDSQRVSKKGILVGEDAKILLRTNLELDL